MRLRRVTDMEAQVEALEVRRLLAVVRWDGGGGDGLWHTPENWSTDQPPGIADDVVIDVPATFTVSLLAAPANVNSLRLGANTGPSMQALELHAPLTVASP